MALDAAPTLATLAKRHFHLRPHTQRRITVDMGRGQRQGGRAPMQGVYSRHAASQHSHITTRSCKPIPHLGRFVGRGQVGSNPDRKPPSLVPTPPFAIRPVKSPVPRAKKKTVATNPPVIPGYPNVWAWQKQGKAGRRKKGLVTVPYPSTVHEAREEEGQELAHTTPSHVSREEAKRGKRRRA